METSRGTEKMQTHIHRTQSSDGLAKHELLIDEGQSEKELKTDKGK